MYQIIVFLVVLLLRFDVSKTFKTSFLGLRSVPKPSSPLLLRLASLNGDEETAEEKRIKHELYTEGIVIWKKVFESAEEWNVVEPSDVAFTLAMQLNFGNLKEFVRELKKNSWKLLMYPMIPDVIIEKIRLEPIEDEEIEPIVDFFLSQKLHQQLACFMALEPRVTIDHLQRSTLDALTMTFEVLFKIKPDKIEEILEKSMGRDKLYLLAPLVACSKQDQKIVRNILFEMIKEMKVEPILQVCMGIMLTVNFDQATFDRNEKLIDFLGEKIEASKSEEILSETSLTDSSSSSETIKVLSCKSVEALMSEAINALSSETVKAPSPRFIPIALKACRIMNLIKFNPIDTQKILLQIHLDETEESVAEMFKIMKKMAFLLKTDHYKKLIDSFRLH